MPKSVTAGNLQPKVFLSYDPADRGIAETVRQKLAEKGIVTLDAQESMLPGENAFLEVGRALQEASAMVVLVSPQSMRNQWVRREVSYALGSKRFAGRLIPLEIRATQKKPWVLDDLPTVRVKRAGSGEEAAGAVAELLSPSRVAA